MDTKSEHGKNCPCSCHSGKSNSRLLKDKVALVTGGSRGIGKAISLKLAQEGAAVAILARSLDSCEELASHIEEKGGKALALSAHIENIEEVEEAIGQVTKKFGHLDYLINNAGITKDSLLMRMSKDDWDTVLGVNLTGAFHCVKSVVRQLVKQRYGKIINISSVIGLTGNPGQANYAATKAGLIGLTKTLAKELAGRGITVNAIAPGFIETDMTENLPQNIREDILGRIPLNRFGQPEDIAGAVTYLLSPAGDYITGQVLVVDGGMVI